MVHLITLLAIICVAYSPGALSIWLVGESGTDLPPFFSVLGSYHASL